MAKEIEVDVLKPLHLKGKKTIEAGVENIKLPDDANLKKLVAAGAVKLKKIEAGAK